MTSVTPYVALLEQAQCWVCKCRRLCWSWHTAVSRLYSTWTDGIYRSVVPAELTHTVYWWGTRCLHRPLECEGFIFANSLLVHSTVIWWYVESLRFDFPSKYFYFSSLYNRKFLGMERCTKHETCCNAAHLSMFGWFQWILLIISTYTFYAIKIRNVISLTSASSSIYQNTSTINTFTTPVPGVSSSYSVLNRRWAVSYQCCVLSHAGTAHSRTAIIRAVSALSINTVLKSFSGFEISSWSLQQEPGDRQTWLITEITVTTSY